MSESTKPRSSAPWFDWRQSSVLSDRYLESVLADYKGTALLLLQSPLLAAMAVLVWLNVDTATQSLYFVMTLSCLWIGCVDACREIVKEKALFLRERMVNLQVGPYLVSKVRVLVILGAVQAVTYGGIIAYFLDVRVNLVLLLLNLWLVTIAGTGLGLLISAMASRSDYAVGAVPLVILPQILFSEFAIKKDDFAGVSEVIYYLMPSRWTFESLLEMAETNPDWVYATLKMLPALGFAIVFVALAWLPLRLKRY